MKRYNVILFIYIVFFIFWIALFISQKHTLALKGENFYWFSIYYKKRVWFVDKNAKIYNVLPEDDLNSSFFVTGLDIDEENGTVSASLISLIPKDIPDIVFEINLKEKYISTVNSSVIYLTNIEDIENCINILKTIGQYLDSGKRFIFKSGKLYSI
ncbi:MAG: hypothetical protein ACK4E1_02605 [Fervidobacterium nodosum]